MDYLELARPHSNYIPVVLLDLELNVIEMFGYAEKLFNCNRTVLIKNQIYTLFSLNKSVFPYSKQEIFLHLKFVQATHFSSVFVDGIDNNIKLDWMLTLQEQQTVYELSVDQRCIFLANQPGGNFSRAIEQTISRINFTDKNIFSMVRNIVYFLPGKAHFKEAENLNYLVANRATLDLLGYQHEQELVNCNDYNLAKHMGWRWPSKLAQEIQDFDAAVLQSQQPLINYEESPYLNSQGKIVLHYLTKIPISLDNKPVGILTFAMDKCLLNDLMALRHLYNQFYLNKEKANMQFLQHIGLQDFLSKANNHHVNTKLSSREIDTLLMLHQGKTAKEAAAILKISYRTVEKYVEILKIKLNLNSRSDIFDLVKVLKKNLQN